MRSIFRRPIAFAAVGLLLFAVAAGVSLRFMSSSGVPESRPEGPREGGVRMGRLLVAAEDIPARTVITKDLLKRREIPLKAMPADAPRTERQIVGYVTKTAISRGWPVRMSSMAGRVDRMGLAAAIPSGHRAMVVPIAPEPTVHHIVRQGDRIDVTVTFDAEYATIVVEDVEILAVDHVPAGKKAKVKSTATDAEGPQEDQQSLTLAVTSAQAEKLALCTKYSGAQVRYTLHSATERAAG